MRRVAVHPDAVGGAGRAATSPPTDRARPDVPSRVGPLRWLHVLKFLSIVLYAVLALHPNGTAAPTDEPRRGSLGKRLDQSDAAPPPPQLSRRPWLERGPGWEDPVCRPGTGVIGTAMDQPVGTRRMVERLARLREEERENPERNVFLGRYRARLLRQQLDRALLETNAPRVLDLRPRLARQLLNAGETQSALEQYEAYQRLVQQASWRLDTRQSAELAMQMAIVHLRLGEQANCLQGHDAESCLLPLRGGGIHRDKRGALEAIRILTEYAREDPHHLGARWLLNVAHMATGTYPDAVPRRLLIPPRAFQSDADIGRFPDIASDSGVAVDDLAGGVVADDFDRDGWLDLVVSTSRLDGPLRFFRNRGNGTFDERTAEAGLLGLNGGLNLIQADYDNDGWLDVLVLRGGWLRRGGHHPNSLLRNRGDGTFEDVTEAAGVLSFHPTQTAAWFDFDGDGWLDLLIGNESTPDDPHPCELYRNQANGTFIDVATRVGLAVTGFFKAVAVGDYDNDGRPDVYFSDLEGPNRLFRNGGPRGSGSGSEAFRWRFEETTSVAGVAKPEHAFPAWFWDYDNDGWLDLFACGYRYFGVGDIAADYLGMENAAERPRLYRNRGNGTFEDVTGAMGLHRVLLAMGSNFGDLDNDGWLDLYLGTGDPDLGTLVPNRMFRNDRGVRFQDVTTSGGFGHLQKGHGVAFADLDNDGDQDVYQVLGGAMEGDHYPNVLFANPGHGRAWLRLELVGKDSNRSALGARIRVTVVSATGRRTLQRVVGSGGSFGASPLRQEIGLGDGRVVEKIEVFWPATGKTQRIDGIGTDRAYRIREDSPVAEEWVPIKRSGKRAGN